ncbi:MAG TPA: hypothetical protein VKM93_01715 [Terriglobia bacterium]|nr:hypothetical protein [Terriglobia bacterium]
MSMSQQCRPQVPPTGSKPALGDSPLDRGLVLETLNLHGTAINTVLTRLHALELQVGGQQVKSSPAPNGEPDTPNPMASSDWLQAALNRWGPEDGKPLIYFLHIPKTSGTSFHCFLTSAFGEANMSPLRDWADVKSYSGAAGNWKVWSGHFGGLLPIILPSWPRIVTILRDPVDRTISEINHAKRDPVHPLHRYARGMSVLQLCHHVRFRRRLDNSQARYLASLSFAQMLYRRIQKQSYVCQSAAFGDVLFSMDQQYGLLDSAIRVMSDMDMVGIAEAHHQTLRLFARMFNVPAPPEAYHLNKAEPSQLKRADLSAEELECIEELTQIDQLVYECARKRFEHECQQAKLTPQLQ